MNLLSQTCASIRPGHRETALATQKILDEKTKPRGSLGSLESLACQIAAITGVAQPPLPAKAIVVMAADHGVAEEGVSAYPAEVTAQMLANFVRGGAAINVLARQARARLVLVDMGTKRLRGPEYVRAESGRPGSLPGAGVRDGWLGPGTANLAREPAMTLPQALQGVEIGIRLAAELHAAGVGLIGAGEMGIGNTTAASALTAVFTEDSPALVTGRGTGIDDAAWQHKVRIIEKALALHLPRRDQPLETLAQVGGFELAGLVGLILGAAAHRLPLLLDGFITGAAALVAVQLCPLARDYLLASHLSVEPGHRCILEYLRLRPLLQLELRLGEGTGSALAMHLIDAALSLLHDMASFQAAGVTCSGA